MKLRKLLKERGKNLEVVNSKTVRIAFEYRVNILPWFGRICQAARMESLGCLREGGGRGGGLRRGCGFGDDCERYGRGDSGVDFVPDDLVWLFAEDCV